MKQAAVYLALLVLCALALPSLQEEFCDSSGSRRDCGRNTNTSPCVCGRLEYLRANSEVFSVNGYIVAKADYFSAGYLGIKEDECVNTRGCCWAPTDQDGAPWCFVPSCSAAPAPPAAAKVSGPEAESMDG